MAFGSGHWKRNRDVSLFLCPPQDYVPLAHLFYLIIRCSLAFGSGHQRDFASNSRRAKKQNLFSFISQFWPPFGHLFEKGNANGVYPKAHPKCVLVPLHQHVAEVEDYVLHSYSFMNLRRWACSSVCNSMMYQPAGMVVMSTYPSVIPVAILVPTAVYML